MSVVYIESNINSIAFSVICGYIRNTKTKSITTLSIEMLITKSWYTPDEFIHYNNNHFQTSNNKTITNIKSLKFDEHIIYTHDHNKYKSNEAQIIQWVFEIHHIQSDITLGIAPDINLHMNEGFDLVCKDSCPYYSNFEGINLFQLSFKQNEQVIMTLDLEDKSLSFNINDAEDDIIVNDCITTSQDINYTLCIQLPRENDSITLVSTHIYKRHTLTIHPNAENVTSENCHYFEVSCPLCSNTTQKTYYSLIDFSKHFQQHFTMIETNTNNNNDKIWKSFKRDTHFIYHISLELNFKPYKCNVIVGGKLCHHACSNKHNMINHCHVHYQACNEFEGIPPPEWTISHNPETATWSNSHSEFAICPNNECEDTFNSVSDFKVHLKKEFYDFESKFYLYDKTKNAFLRNKKVKSIGNFIEHLYTHLDGAPSICDVTVNDIECNHTSASKKK
eukprot:66925_1